MKNLVKGLGVSILMGAAAQAGCDLWNDVLKYKVQDLGNNLKQKKGNIRKFKRSEA